MMPSAVGHGLAISMIDDIKDKDMAVRPGSSIA
jgi:hypothetical protein